MISRGAAGVRAVPKRLTVIAFAHFKSLHCLAPPPFASADSARAAFSKVVKRGMADPARVSVGGHS